MRIERTVILSLLDLLLFLKTTAVQGCGGELAFGKLTDVRSIAIKKNQFKLNDDV